MRQAGDGADFMEGWEGNGGGGGGVRSRQGSCFKCGQWGHWAANCPAAVPEQPLEPVSVHSLAAIPFSTTAFILMGNANPRVLRRRALKSDALGASSSRFWVSQMET